MMILDAMRTAMAVVMLISAAAPAASSPAYVFRYKNPVFMQEPLIPDAEYGIGNDIAVYYVAPVGYDFTKKIPVATQDVVDWRKDTGEFPGGIGIDPAKGILSGQPAAEETAEALFHGYDRSGNRIARAEIHFTTFEPVGEPVLVDFYAHVGTYFYGEIPSPHNTTVARWAPIAPFATGMSMMGHALQGTPDAAGTWGVAWRGYDYLDREVAFAYGDLLVETGPVIEELRAGEYSTDFIDQVADKNIGETFAVQAAVRRSLGPATYRLVPSGARPAGLIFSSATGTLSGVFDDFETKAEFQIEARDSYDGTISLSKPFTLETLPQEISLSNVYNLYGYAGTPYYRKFTTPNLAPTAQWSVISGTLPEGLTLNPTTGTISGTPAKKETQTDIIVGVSGAGMIAAQSSPFNFTVYPEYVSRETKPLHVRKNTPFTTDGVTVKGAMTAYAISPRYPLQGDLTVDSTTGAVSSASGISNTGSHDLLLIVDNGNEFGVYQSIRVYNPLEVSYENREVKRNDWMSVFPTINPNSTIDGESYSIVDVDGDPLPSWMTFQRSTGRIYGRPTDKSTIDVTYGPFIVTRTDAQDSKPSDPFTIKVVDRDAVDLVITNKGAERFIYNGYRIATPNNTVGSIDYRVVSLPSNWPSTLSISNGGLFGRTEDPVGTVYSDIILEVEDSEGYKDTEGPFDIEVIEPAGLGALYGGLNRTVEWTAGMPYTGSLPKLSNGFGTLGYAFAGAVGGLTLNDATTGAYGFTVPTEGTYDAAFTIDDETDRAPAQGTLSLKINPELTLTAATTLSAHRAAALSSVTPTVSGGTKPFSYVQTGTLPRGVYFSNGTFYGTPEVEGQFPVSVTVTDKAGMSKTSSFTLDVGAPLPIELTYPADALTVGQFKVVWPQVKNTIGALTYVLTAPSDDNGRQILPAGMSFDSTGQFIGAPLEAGVFGPYIVKVTDSDTVPRDGSSGAFNIVITRTGEIDFADVGVRVRKNAPISLTLAAGNIVPPVGYMVSSPEPLPNGLVLNGTTGGITGTLTDEGVVFFAVTAKDRMLREKTATVTFTIVGDMTASASGVSLKQHEASTLTTSVVTTNTLGTPGFALSAGFLPAGLSVDPASGAINGTSDEAGSWPISVDVTDTDGQTKTVSFTVTVEPRDPLVVQAPTAVSVKRFSMTNFAATVTDAIPPVAYEVTPDLPIGITLDPTTGEITGSSDDVVAYTVYTLTATDAKGGELGTDTTQFTLQVEEREALTIAMSNVAGKRYEDIAPVTAVPASAIGAVTYSVSPTLPTGFSLDPVSGAISGRSDAVIEETTFTLTATDEKAGELGTATATFTITVTDRDALEFATTSEQAVLLDEPYSLALAVNNIVGTNLTFTEVSGALPEGLTFDAATGTVSGTSVNYDEKTIFTVKAEDDFGGEATLVIAFAVGITPGELTITAFGGTTRVNEPFVIAAPTAANTVGTVTWSLAAPGTGLSINPSTGEISGTPLAAIETDAAITVKDGTGRRGATTVRVKAIPRIDLAVADPIAATFNYEIDPAQQAVATQVVGTAVWSISGPVLPSGLGFDTLSGAITGKPLEIGTFGPYTLTVGDDLPGTTSKSFSIQTVMNGDAIELAVTDFETKLGYPVQTAAPSYGNNLGPVTFFSTDLAATGLTIDPATGALTGTAQALTDRFINISVRDRDTTRVTSRPLRYKVIPNMQITLPAQVTVSALSDITPISPTRINIIGDAVWEPLDQSTHKLPEGLEFDVTTGTIRGNATVIGTFGPFTVASVDGLGDRGVSNSFVIRSNPGPLFIGLASADLPQGTKRTTPYTYDFIPLLTTIGMDLSEVSWSTSGSVPPGLTMANGVLSGTPSLSGDFTFTVSVRFEGVVANRTYTVRIVLPETSLALAPADLGEAKRALRDADHRFEDDLGSRTTFENIQEESIVYTIEPYVVIDEDTMEAFPAGLALSSDGIITGTATDSPGIYTFRIKAAFQDSTDELVESTATFTIHVKETVTIAFSNAVFNKAYKRLDYTFDLGTLIDATTTKGVTADQLTWSWAVNPERAPETTMPTTPAGLYIGGHHVLGRPTNSGTYDLDVTAEFDGRKLTKRFTLQSDLQTTELSFSTSILPQGTVREVYSSSLRDMLTAVNFPVSDVQSFVAGDTTVADGQISGLPPGLTLDPTNGTLSGTPTAKGTYLFKADATWEETNSVAESKTASNVVTIEIKGLQYFFTQISVGASHTCGVTLEGGVKCWGANDSGKLGLPTSTAGSIFPVDIAGMTGVSKVSAGPNNTCAILTNGTARCWGLNSNGQLGIGNTATTPTPTLVRGNVTDWAEIEQGLSHTCGRTNSDKVYCWGNGINGMLGFNASRNFSDPQEVTVLSGTAAQLSVGESAACVVTAAGGVKCWGAGNYGITGSGSPLTTPTNVTGATSGVASVSVGGRLTAIVTTAGAVQCWGSSCPGGTGTNVRSVAGFTGMTQVSTGASHVCARSTTGAARCYGATTMIGSSATTVPAVPENVQSVSVAANTSCVLMNDKTMKCWGDNSSGQLGDGTTTPRTRPVDVPG